MNKREILTDVILALVVMVVFTGAIYIIFNKVTQNY